MDIDHLPFRRTWLDDIIDELIQSPNGTNHVDAIVNRLMLSGRHMGRAPKETVTRTINNYCTDARDSNRSARVTLFERVGPNEYRLASYPNRPDLTEYRSVEFSEITYDRAWKHFQRELEYSGKKKAWQALSQSGKLRAFIKHVVDPDGSRHDLLLGPTEE